MNDDYRKRNVSNSQLFPNWLLFTFDQFDSPINLKIRKTGLTGISEETDDNLKPKFSGFNAALLLVLCRRCFDDLGTLTSTPLLLSFFDLCPPDR